MTAFLSVMGATILALIWNYSIVLCLILIDAPSEASTVPEWVRAPVIVGGSPGSVIVVATSILAQDGVYMVSTHLYISNVTRKISKNIACAN